MTFIVYPIAFYFVWVTIYYLINFVLARKRIRDRNYDNMFESYQKKPWAKKFLNTFGHNFAPVIFIAAHFAFFFTCLICAMPCLYSYEWHTFCMIFWLTWSVWNGSCFYMDYFSKKYESSLQRLEEVEQQLNDK